jgi:hypothetical protein
MKLQDILYEYDKSPKEIVRAYTNDFTKRPELEQAVQQLSSDPANVYVGDMYRVIFKEVNDVVKMPSTQALLSNIHRYDINEPRTFFSWSKTIKGVIRAMEINTGDGEGEGVYSDQFALPSGVVLQQSGRALDIGALLGDGVVDAAEEELLANYQGTVSIAGFLVAGKRIQFFPVDQFREFIQVLQAEMASGYYD